MDRALGFLHSIKVWYIYGMGQEVAGSTPVTTRSLYSMKGTGIWHRGPPTLFLRRRSGQVRWAASDNDIRDTGNAPKSPNRGVVVLYAAGVVVDENQHFAVTFRSLQVRNKVFEHLLLDFLEIAGGASKLCFNQQTQTRDTKVGAIG